MKLYILRHGHSPSAAQAGVASDGERPLSPRGREDARRMAALLGERGGRPSLILHSPLKRATETAQEAAAVLKPSAVEMFQPLANILSGEDLRQALAERLPDAGEALVVGHQPQIGELTALLSGLLFSFPPAGLVALDWNGAQCGVLWTCNPEDPRS